MRLPSDDDDEDDDDDDDDDDDENDWTAQCAGLLLSGQSPLLQARPSLPYPSIVTTEWLAS